MSRLAQIVPVLAISLLASAASQGGEAPAPSPKPLMESFLEHMLALQPLMASDTQFGSARNARFIRGHLDALAKAAGSIDHYARLQAPGYAISGELLAEHARRTDLTFRSGMTSHARWMLNELVQGCISCHGQQPTPMAGLMVDASRVQGTDLERADFLFATHQFEQAQALYAQVIARFRAQPAAPDPLVVSGDVEHAVNQQMALFLRIRRDPVAAAQALETDLANPELPADLRSMINEWVAEVRKPGLLPTFEPSHAPRTDLQHYADGILAGDLHGPDLFVNPVRRVRYLVLSSVLYEALSGTHAGVSTSEILFWLAKCDAALSNDFFFSSSDLYLQECITRAPHTPVAGQCFHELAGRMTLEYTGSSGTDLPPDVIRLLARFESLAR